MKIGIISDVHGETHWKPLIENYGLENIDKLVFLGDYVDSYTVDDKQMVENFREIIKLKIDNPAKVELILGNHDMQYYYLYSSNYRCSGFREKIANELSNLTNTNRGLFVNAYQVDNIVFSHAGIQDNWFKQRFKGDSKTNIADQLNNPSNSQRAAMADVGYYRGGYQNVGGIFWADRTDLKKPLQGYVQIVGHSIVHKVTKHQFKNATIYFCDCLLTQEELLVFDTEKKEFTTEI